MPISHICLRCGADQARIRPRRDAVYGLPIVTCPGCGAASVRRPHPVPQRAREMLAIAGAVTALGGQMLAFLFLSSMVTLICIGLAYDGERFLRGDDVPAILLALRWLMMLLIPVLLGAWLTAGLSHWRRGPAWCIFTALIAMSLSMDVLLLPALEAGLAQLGATSHEFTFSLEVWLLRLIVLSVLMLVATAGIPLGRALIALTRRIRRFRRRVQRRAALRGLT